MSKREKEPKIHIVKPIGHVVHIIKCDNCGTETGRIELPPSLWAGKKPTNADLGIASSICDDCKKPYEPPIKKSNKKK